MQKGFPKRLYPTTTLLHGVTTRKTSNVDRREYLKHRRFGSCMYSCLQATGCRYTDIFLLLLLY